MADERVDITPRGILHDEVAIASILESIDKIH
jgi:hypothetical protein